MNIHLIMMEIMFKVMVKVRIPLRRISFVIVRRGYHFQLYFIRCLDGQPNFIDLQIDFRLPSNLADYYCKIINLIINTDL